MAPKERDVHAVIGMGGQVYDWRGTGFLPPSGGVIPLRAFVHHIPVIKNVEGIGDFVTLANVLRAQGLSLQFATDREGNVALYNDANRLCYQAKGANSQSCGCEHMHYTINEPWTERQYRAAAWLAWWVKKNHGLPARNAWARSGPGVVVFTRTGHYTHEGVSDKAGFHDRSDPGEKFHRGHVYALERYYAEHRHFKHAPTLG